MSTSTGWRRNRRTLSECHAPWSAAEKRILMQLAPQTGDRSSTKWNEISSALVQAGYTRSPIACREYWRNTARSQVAQIAETIRNEQEGPSIASTTPWRKPISASSIAYTLILYIPVNSYIIATETAIGPPVLIMPSDSSKFKWGIYSVKVLSNISLLCNLVWRQYPVQVEYKSKD
jgi:hypothetical protein